MTEEQWKVFCEYRDEYKKLCEEWNRLESELFPLQKAACKDDTPEYKLETAVVYNTAYDEITPADEIKLIVIGDNPGKDEQRACNRKYLVGQSGKIADGFFKKNPELGIDFRKNVIIMNKTPVHTAKTKHLKYLLNNGSDDIKVLLNDSQIKMAEMAARVQNGLGCPLWLVGYGELGDKGIFGEYKATLKNIYLKSNSLRYDWNQVFVYQHFSMNRFIVDLKKFKSEHENLPLEDCLVLLGHEHRDVIFG